MDSQLLISLPFFHAVPWYFYSTMSQWSFKMWIILICMVFKKKKAENENQPCVAKGTYLRLSGGNCFSVWRAFSPSVIVANQNQKHIRGSFRTSSLKMTCTNKLLPLLAMLAAWLEGWQCQFGPDWNISPTEWTECTDIHGPQIIHPFVFDDSLTFPLGPWGPHLWIYDMYQQLLGGLPRNLLHTLLSLSGSGVSRLIWLG